MRPNAQMVLGGFRRPGKALIALLIINVAAYVFELIAIRAGIPVAEYLFLTPAKLFEDGYVWQAISYTVLHSPTNASHLLSNMLWLYIFGTSLEQWWGSKRFVSAYVIFALSGAALTLVVALLSLTPVLSWLVPNFWYGPHVGASGAVVGLTLAWGLVYGDQEINLLFLGQMKGRTFALIILGIELITALSFDQTSSTSHFGGMIGAYILCRGLWRPGKWTEMFRRRKLLRDRKRIERELRILEGGKKDDLPN